MLMHYKTLSIKRKEGNNKLCWYALLTCQSPDFSSPLYFMQMRVGGSVKTQLS